MHEDRVNIVLVSVLDVPFGPSVMLSALLHPTFCPGRPTGIANIHSFLPSDLQLSQANLRHRKKIKSQEDRNIGQ